MKSLDIVNVASFGASGNGATNSSTAFQNAINSLPNGGEIRVPAGTYIVRDIVIKSGIHLIGEGAATVLKLPSDSKVWSMVLITGGDVPAKNVVISDLTIDGSADMIGLRDVQMHGIDVQGGSKEVLIKRVHFQNMCGDGIRITEDGQLKIVPQYVNIEASTFESIGRQDIAVVHGYDVKITDSTGTGSLDIEPEKPLVKRVTVINCTFTRLDAASSNRSAGIIVRNSRFQDALLWNLSGIHIESSEFGQMRISSARDVTIHNNRMKMLEIFPPSGKKSTDITITDNIIENIAKDTNSPVAGFSDHLGVGIYMWNAQDSIISNNIIRAEVIGIYISSGCNQISIKDNTIELVEGNLPSEYGLFSIQNSNGVTVSKNTFIGWQKGVLVNDSRLQTNKMIGNNLFREIQ